VVKANLEAHGLVDSLAYWTVTDAFEENGAGQEPFHGGFGLLSQHGISKPTMHAYRMLAALGNELLHQQPGAAVTRHSATGAVTTLLYHYPAEVTLDRARLVDAQHGNALSEWQRLASPTNPAEPRPTRSGPMPPVVWSPNTTLRPTACCASSRSCGRGPSHC
jgi:beta-xylosidase